MDQSEMDKAGKKKAVGAELIIPVAAAAYALYYVYTILDYPMEAQINGLFLAGVLCTLVAILLVRTAIQWVRGEVSLNMASVIAPFEILPARAGFLLLTVGFAVAIRWFGFTLTTWLYLLGCFLILGVRSRPILIFLPAGAAIAGYLFFIVALHTRFPKGPIEHLLAGIF